MENRREHINPNSEKAKLEKNSINETCSDPTRISQTQIKGNTSLPSISKTLFLPTSSDSPPKFVSGRQLMEVTSGIRDICLTHEIVVNEKFLLENATTNGEESVSQDYWEDLEKQLNETPPNNAEMMFLFKVVKDSLFKVLLPQHHKIRSQIDETLDLDLIRQQMESGSLDYHHYAEYIISVMAKLCAPVRDTTIEELRSMDGIIHLYIGILRTLDLMKLDMANFTIQQMRPHIRLHSVEYEKQKFKELIAKLASMSPPIDYLTLTKRWIKGTYDKIKGGPIPAIRLTKSQVMAKAFVELLMRNDDKNFPETLLMDQERFMTVLKQYREMVIAASVLLITYSIVGEPIYALSSLKLRLKEQVFVLLKNASNICKNENIKELLKSVALQIIKEVNHSLVERGFASLSEGRAADLSLQIEDVSLTQNRVLQLISTRVLEFVEKVLNSSNAASVKIPPGLSAFQEELIMIAGTFLRLASYNQAVFGDYYVDIITEILEEKPEYRQNEVN